MFRLLFCCSVILSLYTSDVTGTKQDFYQKCKDNITKTLSCSTQLSEPDDVLDADVCKVVVSKPLSSTECREMSFGPFQPDKPFNTGFGRVSLRPYILDNHGRSFNFTVLNISFTNIKWKTMKFRFHEPSRPRAAHCRQLAVRPAAVDARSVLYYDCYWSAADEAGGARHYLDFQAEGEDGRTSRGQYFFNVPNMQMLSTSVTAAEWKPFLYIEVLALVVRLHVAPPPPQLTDHIQGFAVQVRRAGSEGALAAARLPASAADAVYDYSLLRGRGPHYFLVTPLHAACRPAADPALTHGCQTVASPVIDITIDSHQTLNICIVSVSALVVTALFAYYLALRYLRRHCCRDYRAPPGEEVPPPTKVLVISPADSAVHAACVARLVACLRALCGLDVLCAADVPRTPHRDPLLWAQAALAAASHVLYVCGPPPRATPPAAPALHALQLSLLRAHVCSKRVANVRFDHSRGPLPPETRHCRTFHLLKDWNKMVGYLTRDLIPATQLARTENGKSLIDDLKKAKKLLESGADDAMLAGEKDAFDKILV